MAKARLDQANAEVALAKLHLSFTVIRAPFSGTIDRIPKKLGSLIDEGELLTSLSDNSQIYAYFNVSEPEYLQYQQNVKDILVEAYEEGIIDVVHDVEKALKLVMPHLESGKLTLEMLNRVIRRAYEN